MSSRRDQVDAQRYMLSRVTGALVRAEPETAESPTRRDRTGTVAGLVFGLLLLGVTAIWALFPGSGSTRWQQPHMLVVDDRTGARYVLVSGQLRPVDDVATATLLTGGGLTPVVVSSATLAKVPRGVPVGNPAGPQVLPAADRLNAGVWRACDLGQGHVGLDIGVPAGAQPLGGGEAVPVTGGGKTYLLWGGRRLLLGEAWVADVLGLGLVPPIPVGAAWLDLIPLSGTAGPPTVEGDGGNGPTVAGKPSSIGQMFLVDLGNGKVGHYMMTRGGMAPLTETEYLLQRARPGSVAETAIGAADLAATPQRTPVHPLTTLPATPPRPRSTPDGAAVCVEYTGRPDHGPTVVLSPDYARPGTVAATVRVSPGGGALLLPRLDGDAAQLPAVLVDERGIGYPLAGRDISTLGYAAAQAVVMPSALVALVPAGPALVRPEGG
ncbi:type VII secretion protein EccB [Dactylosporangium sp. CA-233914]|uniref:type VII secretion protein EccB n=1 Tax=Dactylosporangium sp. CA-233914 TaxID=3239934 RepID=UPI003D8B95F8